MKKVSENQPKTFEFTSDNLKKFEEILKIYPKERKQSAVMPLLYLAQSQNDNWIPLAAIKYIGNKLEMPYINVYEVATFYSMYNLSPVGKYHVQVCTTSPCMLRGSEKILKKCKEKISKFPNTLSENKNCSWTEVECLGACVNAPMIQINSDYFEDLDEKSITEILEMINSGKQPKPGSYKNRKNSAPFGSRTTLLGAKDA